MTRPRCPKCQKYYVTLAPEQRPLPARTVAAIKRTIRREPPPVSPYRRYQCDICGYHWAVLLDNTTTGALVSAASTATRSTLGTSFGISVLPMRESQRSYPLSGKTTGVLTAKHPTARATAQNASRPATLMAARRASPSAARHPEVSGRWHLSGDDEPTVPRRTLTQGGASSARFAGRSHSPDTGPTDPTRPAQVTAKLAPVRVPRWQGVWRSFLPSRAHHSTDLSSDVAS